MAYVERALFRVESKVRELPPSNHNSDANESIQFERKLERRYINLNSIIYYYARQQEIIFLANYVRIQRNKRMREQTLSLLYSHST